MPHQKLTIVPVTLHSNNEHTAASTPAALSSSPTCTIKMCNAEIFFFNGVDEHIVQTIIRELKDQ